MNANFGDINIIVSRQDADAIWNKIDDIDAIDAAHQAKLDTIEEGAEANVQSDWDETDTDADEYIDNKPDALTTAEIQDIVNGLE